MLHKIYFLIVVIDIN